MCSKERELGRSIWRSKKSKKKKKLKKFILVKNKPCNQEVLWRLCIGSKCSSRFNVIAFFFLKKRKFSVPSRTTVENTGSGNGILQCPLLLPLHLETSWMIRANWKLDNQIPLIFNWSLTPNCQHILQANGSSLPNCQERL